MRLRLRFRLSVYQSSSRLRGARMTKHEPLQASLHRKMMLYLRTYMIVRGMPQAVLVWKDTQDFDAVDKAKRLVLNLYRNDIYQYAGVHAKKAVKIWGAIPGQLQKREKRFRIGQVKKGARTRDFEGALFWLREAQIVNFYMAATEPSVGLSLNEDDMRYKIYLNDTGLLLSHAFSEDQRSLNELYRKLMLGKLELNKGMLVENLVAQMLRATGKKLFFFATNDPNNNENTMEIDFLIRKPQITNKHNISPVEVKSTQKYSFSSLTRFMTKYNNFAATPYIVHSGEFKIYEGFVYLPLYMAPLLQPPSQRVRHKICRISEICGRNPIFPKL